MATVRAGFKEDGEYEMVRRLFCLLFLATALLTGAGASRAHAQELQPQPPAGLERAIFAGGCFWCMVHPFDSLDGVKSVTSGYSGGKLANPTYEQVSAGGSGHIEVVEVVYDPDTVAYAALLDIFWRNVDPFDGTGQFCDRGSQYRPAIFVENDAQRAAAEESKHELEDRFDRSIAVDILPASPFYRAEDYHQDYYKKKPLRYNYYRFSCGRDARLEKVWGEEAGGGKG